MTGVECEQLGLDNEWSLARLNSCHIGVQNADSERTTASIEAIEDDIVEINHSIESIADMQSMMLWGLGIVVAVSLGSVLKIFWAKVFNGKNK